MENTPIRVISPNFDFLGEIDDYESLIFIRRHLKVGDFELRININKNTDILQEDNIILLGQDGKKAGVIRHREIALDENGEDSEILLIRGYTLKGVISRRRIVPDVGKGFMRAEGSTEYIMKYFVDKNFFNPADIERRIPQVAIAPNQNRGQQDKWRGSFEVVSDKLEEIGEYSQIGWDVFLDIVNKKWIFDVVVGRDLTVNQNILPPVIFSVDFDNIKGQSYIDSAINHANVAYAGGQGEEENRLIQQIGSATGFERIETFLDCSSAEDVTELIEEGNRGLEELKKIKTFESQVLDFGSFIYGQDWDLGDIVSTQNKKWNLTMDTRIVEVKEIYEENGFNLELVFGNTVPDFMDKVKKIEKKQILNTGKTGESGEDGVGIEYTWNGTELGVKRENESNYSYVNLVGPQGERGPQGLKGDKGDQGPQGIPGLNGKSLEFHWNGTQLGVRVEGQANYQYVNLKGEKGNTGPKGADGYTPIKGVDYFDGEQGPKGDQGIQGPQGIQGKTGPIGPQGKSIEYVWNGTKLGIRVEGETSYTYVDLRGPQGLKGDTGPQGIQGPKGDIGPEGPQGPIGLTGPKGDRGLRGPEGPQGPAGSDANVTKENVINAIGYTPANTVHKHSKSDIADFPSSLPANGGNANTVGGKKASDFVQIHNSNLPYVDSFIVYGDSDKYYPVIVSGGNQDLLRTIKIWRRYSEKGPSDWYRSTHKGSLTLHWMGNFGSWGGASYREIIVENTSLYTTLLADCFRTNHHMAYCFMLRGGGKIGARYHIASDQPIQGHKNRDKPVDIFYSGDEISYNNSNPRYVVYAPEPVTVINTDKLEKIKVAKISDIPTKLSQLTNDEGYLKSLPSHDHTANEVKFIDGETFQQKLDLGKLTGPQGIKGVTGLQGPKGDKGDIGPVGPPGTTTWAGITDRPTKLSQFQNDLTIESGGTNIVTSATEPAGLGVGDQWHKEI